jgi:hypothetical protein
MSNFLLVRGIDASAVQPLFDAWKAPRQWVRCVELRDAWELQQLEINGRNANAFLQGKHKAELAELVLLIQEHGGQVIHLSLVGKSERYEEDLGEWASRRTSRPT